MAISTEQAKYTIVENAGYVGECDVESHPRVVSQFEIRWSAGGSGLSAKDGHNAGTGRHRLPAR